MYEKNLDTIILLELKYENNCPRWWVIILIMVIKFFKSKHLHCKFYNTTIMFAITETWTLPHCNTMILTLFSPINRRMLLMIANEDNMTKIIDK